MVDTPEHIAQRLAEEGQRILVFFQNLAPQDWELRVYEQGEVWTTRELLAHFIASERAFLELVQNILAGGPGVSVTFDIDEYNKKSIGQMDSIPLQDLLQSYQALRAQTVALARRMKQEDFTRVGRHPFLGPTSLAEMIKMIYRHQQIHLRDLRRIVSMHIPGAPAN